MAREPAPEIHVHELGNAIYTLPITRKYRKHAALVMFDGARGPLWLRRAVLQIAKWLKMLGHDRECIESVGKMRVARINPNDADLIVRVDRLVLDVCRHAGLTPDQIEVVAGQDQFEELRAVLSRAVPFMVPIDIRHRKPGYGEMVWRGVRFRVVPWLTGMAVLPR